MNVLVVYASRHGSTAGIAERIAAGLRDAGLAAEARPVAQVDDVDGHNAFVVGSAAYMFHWLKDATRFVKRHRAVLAKRPVWLAGIASDALGFVGQAGAAAVCASAPALAATRAQHRGRER